MRRALKFLLKTALFLLLLPLLVVLAMFFYGKTMIYLAGERQATISAQQERVIHSGNGFGGDEGMHVIDSGYRSRQFFWIDDDHLAFQKDLKAGEPADTRKHYVWDIKGNIIKPLTMQGGIVGFFDGNFRFAKASENQFLPDGRKKVDRFQSTLRELDDRWVLENIQKSEELVEPAPARYELVWEFDGKPWFRLKSELRTESDIPKHRFTYLWEWGWILRTPWVGPEHFDQAAPAMGFFDINGAIYADQPGKKMADPVELPPADVISLKVVYIGFLDKYWLANKFHAGTPKPKFMGFLDRAGAFQAITWPDSWPEYADIPLPTRKGLFWSGQDFRSTSPTQTDKGTFVRDAGGFVYKVVQGSALRSLMSSDGCKVAFYNPPRSDRDTASLKVLNICQSTMDGKELTNVDY